MLCSSVSLRYSKHVRPERCDPFAKLHVVISQKSTDFLLIPVAKLNLEIYRVT